MLRTDLVARVADLEPHLTTKQAEAVVSAILNRISDALVAGERVEIRGFGAFTVKPRKGRAGRNPKTGAVVSVADKLALTFKTGKPMQARLNASAPPDASDELEGTASRLLRGF